MTKKKSGANSNMIEEIMSKVKHVAENIVEPIEDMVPVEESVKYIKDKQDQIRHLAVDLAHRNAEKLINKKTGRKHIITPKLDTWADRATKVIGSWSFIISQSIIITVWVFLNVTGIFKFDNFPFIFLNLFMSLQAAYTAPIIMMSQTRSAQRDRERQELDYQINVLAEQEIEMIFDYLNDIKVKLSINSTKEDLVQLGGTIDSLKSVISLLNRK